MEIVILENATQVAARSAALVSHVVQREPKPVLGLATGATPLGMYRCLVAEHQSSQLSFRMTMSFNLDEYFGIAPDHNGSFRSFMNREFFKHIDIDPANTYFPECAGESDPVQASESYERRIRQNGGIDLQILGVGRNGHIGFNEPTSSLTSRTRLKTLTENTRSANAAYFSEAPPRLAMTMGLATILDAKDIVLIATGEAKSEAVRQLVEGPVTAMCPASVLQMHQAVTVLLDGPAASQLALRDYYSAVQKQRARLRIRSKSDCHSPVAAGNEVRKCC